MVVANAEAIQSLDGLRGFELRKAAADLVDMDDPAAQLGLFIEYVDDSDNPVRVARALFKAYLYGAVEAGRLMAGDVLVPAQAFLTGSRVGEPLDTQHQALLGGRWPELRVALEGLQAKCRTF